MADSVVGVIGSGVMGGGIAQMFAEHGFRVLLWDVDPARLGKGVAAIEGRLRRSAEKGTLEAALVPAILGRIRRAAGLEEFAGAGLVVEAVTEEAAVKQDTYRKLAAVIGPDTIVGTNTSSLSVAALAPAVAGPERFLGIHFFNPPTRLELVEVVPGPQTALRVVETVKGLLAACGKTPVVVKDSPGFIVNRLLLLMINEAARMADEGVATPEDIDTAMRLGALHPAGPLAVADLIGLDTCERILDVLRDTIGGSSYAPAAGLSARVRSGKLGRKSGEGFFRA